MSDGGLAQLFELFSLIFIYGVIGNFAILPICIILFLELVIEVLCIYDNACDSQKRVLLEEARRRLSKEISIVSASVSKDLKRITTKETAKLEAARAEARKRRSKDVATITALIMKQVLAAQMEDKAKEEATKLSAQAKAERATAIERKRRGEEHLAAQLREKLKAEGRERLAALERERAAFNLTQIALPEDLRDLDPLANDFTCIGEKAAGGRCTQWMFSPDDLSYAADRLKTMRSKNPGKSFEVPQLLQLANWMLCPRWHRYEKPQGKEIAIRWFRQLQPAREALSASNEARKAPVTPVKTLGGSPALESSPSSSTRSRTNSTGSSFGRSSMPETPLSSFNQSPPLSASLGAVDTLKYNEPSRTTPGDPRANLTSKFQGLAKRRV
ncbi:hypothetical protein K432DRAFT_430108 [Lepidopterella palustris CBS 459.81]|uniref:Uncharacterized protein n=1 Tax=Lepidopterella palustris CBS 459.81 TaxID=1314670 RepID=A0A8E2J9D4_9PEZI|nr:hypothetical protein K432DRAFT_430108 [Lepidopterella palustris CBS 459.81]